MINKLPDECLLRIFARLPASDSFHGISAVCKRWRRLRAEFPPRAKWKELVVERRVLHFKDRVKYVRWLTQDSLIVITQNVDHRTIHLGVRRPTQFDWQETVVPTLSGHVLSRQVFELGKSAMLFYPEGDEWKHLCVSPGVDKRAVFAAERLHSLIFRHGSIAELLPFRYFGGENPVLAIALSHNTLELWNLNAGKRKTFRFRQSFKRFLFLEKEGHRLVIGHCDCNAVIMDIDQRSLLFRIQRPLKIEQIEKGIFWQKKHLRLACGPIRIRHILCLGIWRFDREGRGGLYPMRYLGRRSKAIGEVVYWGKWPYLMLPNVKKRRGIRRLNLCGPIAVKVKPHPCAESFFGAGAVSSLVTRHRTYSFRVTYSKDSYGLLVRRFSCHIKYASLFGKEGTFTNHVRMLQIGPASVALAAHAGGKTVALFWVEGKC